MTKKVLIVDDEIDYAFLVQARLLRSGYKVWTAPHGEKALEVAERELPDVILLDILMPIMDGYETLTRLKASQQTNLIPVIMFSAKSQPEDLLQARKLKAFDYIVKPFESVELLEKIKRAIELRNSSQA